MIIVKAPMRLSFAGGGSDLPGFLERETFGKTLTTTLNKYVYVTINKSSSSSYRLVYSSIEECLDPAEIKHVLLRNLLSRHRPKNPVELFSIADLPARGTGLGASSAFCLASVAALTKHNGMNLDSSKLATEASFIEMNMSQNASGYQDQFASALGGLSLNTFSITGLVDTENFLDSKEKHENYLDWINRHVSFVRVEGARDSSSILRGIDFNDSVTLSLQREITDMTVSFARSITKRNLLEMGELMSLNWRLKKTLSPEASNAEVDSMFELGVRHGAFGGKLLGAGGSGYLVFIVEDSIDFLRRMNLEDTGIRISADKMEILEV